jgi:hypothetical protein
LTVAGRWFTRRAVALHLSVAAIVPTFAVLCDWQVHRALSGNALSWAYAFEWPFFAGYALYLWWRLLHEDAWDEPAGPRHRHQAVAGDGVGHSSDPGAGTSAEDEDPELVAYNRYLAELHASGRRKHW